MISINTKKHGLIKMSYREFARWACLIEAYHFINEKATELNINPSQMIKPMAIEKYIEERYHAMLHDVMVEYSAY